MATRRCVMPAVSMRVMTMVTASAKSTSTPSKASGRCCVPGCVRTAASRRTNCRSILASFSSCTTHVGVEKLCSGPLLVPSSRKATITPEPDKSHARNWPCLAVKAGRGASAARFIVVLDSKGAAMNIRYRVDLNEAEQTQLAALLNGGTHAVRKIKRAQILLAADAGASDEVIASTVSVGVSTVYRTRRRFVEGNLEAALSEEARPGASRKLSG